MSGTNGTTAPPKNCADCSRLFDRIVWYSGKDAVCCGCMQARVYRASQAEHEKKWGGPENLQKRMDWLNGFKESVKNPSSECACHRPTLAGLVAGQCWRCRLWGSDGL